jgi:hypothetical protein
MEQAAIIGALDRNRSPPSPGRAVLQVGGRCQLARPDEDFTGCGGFGDEHPLSMGRRAGGGNGERHEFRMAERPGETQRQQRAVAGAAQRVRGQASSVAHSTSAVAT